MRKFNKHWSEWICFSRKTLKSNERLCLRERSLLTFNITIWISKTTLTLQTPAWEGQPKAQRDKDHQQCVRTKTFHEAALKVVHMNRGIRIRRHTGSSRKTKCTKRLSRWVRKLSTLATEIQRCCRTSKEKIHSMKHMSRHQKSWRSSGRPMPFWYRWWRATKSTLKRTTNQRYRVSINLSFKFRCQRRIIGVEIQSICKSNNSKIKWAH